jgi:hypothetical protein
MAGLRTIAGHDSLVREAAFTRDGKGVVVNADALEPDAARSPRRCRLRRGSLGHAGKGGWREGHEAQWRLIRDAKAAVDVFQKRVKPAKQASPVRQALRRSRQRPIPHARIRGEGTDWRGNSARLRLRQRQNHRTDDADSRSYFKQQFLNFFPLPQGQGSFRPTFCLDSVCCGARVKLAPSLFERAALHAPKSARRSVSAPLPANLSPSPGRSVSGCLPESIALRNSA